MLFSQVYEDLFKLRNDRQRLLVSVDTIRCGQTSGKLEHFIIENVIWEVHLDPELLDNVFSSLQSVYLSSLELLNEGKTVEILR